MNDPFVDDLVPYKPTGHAIHRVRNIYKALVAGRVLTKLQAKRLRKDYCKHPMIVVTPEGHVYTDVDYGFSDMDLNEISSAMDHLRRIEEGIIEQACPELFGDALEAEKSSWHNAVLILSRKDRLVAVMNRDYDNMYIYKPAASDVENAYIILKTNLAE